MIDALQWGVRPTALRTLAPGSTLAPWVSCLPLRLERCGSCTPATNSFMRQRAICSIYIAPTTLITDGSAQTTTAPHIASPAQTATTLCVSRVSCSSCEASAAPRRQLFHEETVPRAGSENLECSTHLATSVECLRTDAPTAAR
jgi:hypothetical protein